MTYCVVEHKGRWAVALLTGKGHKELIDGPFSNVRAACREAGRRNAALERTSATVSHEEAA